MIPRRHTVTEIPARRSASQPGKSARVLLALIDARVWSDEHEQGRDIGLGVLVAMCISVFAFAILSFFAKGHH